MTLGRCLAVIPARGGSKGLPGKNIRPLRGLPLLGHSLACARLASRIDRTIVSTDSEEIARVARGLGADVPFTRPPELARDDTPMMPVLQHALAFAEEQDKTRYDVLLLLDPTSPCRLPDDLERGFDLLESRTDVDGVVACSEPFFNPFFTGVAEGDGGILEHAFKSDDEFFRRQQLPRFLRINGSLYIWRTEFLRTAPAKWMKGKHLPLEIPEIRAFSIDDKSEFDLIEAVLAQGVVKLPWLEETKS